MQMSINNEETNNSDGSFDQPSEEVAQEIQNEPQEFSFDAEEAAGKEATLGTLVLNVAQQTSAVVPGPGKVLGTGFKSFFTSIAKTFKKPLRLIPIIILVIIWLVIGILEANDINPLPVQIIDFITFASGGLHGGFIGAIGGIVGKGLFATTIVVIVGLFKKENKSEKRSFKETMQGVFDVSLSTLFAFLTGVGLAMFFYLFISGGATRISFMGGIATAFMALRATLNCGFLQNLINSFTSKGKPKAGSGAAGFLRGVGLGSVLASFLGLINIWLILLIIGLVFFVVGGTLVILQATGVIAFKKGERIT